MNYIQVFIEPGSLLKQAKFTLKIIKRGEIAHPESEKNRNDVIFVL